MMKETKLGMNKKKDRRKNKRRGEVKRREGEIRKEKSTEEKIA